MPFHVRALEEKDLPVVGVLAGRLVRMHYALDPKRYLKPGDIIEVEAEGVGLLRNGVIDEA